VSNEAQGKASGIEAAELIDAYEALIERKMQPLVERLRVIEERLGISERDPSP
jgi:hypothetical protein